MILSALHINSPHARMGNQIFMIASTIGIGETLGIEYAFDGWNKYYNRFNCTFDNNLRDKIKNKQVKYFKEQSHNIDYNMLQHIQQNKTLDICVFLLEYLQDYRYFDKQRDKILDQFKFDRNLKKDTCSIHVRRGDYVNNQNLFPCCTLDYYTKAIKYVKDNSNTKKFEVYSDDIEWCKTAFKESDIEFMETGDEVDDLVKMANCEHNIIANSSYSWWAAYLNDNENKLVVKPKTWFGPGATHLNTTGYIVKDWKEI